MMLEHLPYELALQAFREMARVSKRSIVISLPDVKPVAHYRFYLPFLGSYSFLVPRPRLKIPVHEFDGQHYWEINKKGYELKKVVGDLCQHAKLAKTFRVAENTFHRFFIFETS